MRVLLVDPDPAVRAAAREALAALGDDTVFDEADRLDRSVEALARGPDLVLVEPLLPDGSGLDLLRAAERRDPAPPVLVLTDLDRDIDRFWALRLGAHAFLRKPIDAAVLLDRARKALEGAPRLTPERV